MSSASPRPPRSRRTLVALGTLLVTLGLAEVGVRAWLFGFASERRLVKYARPQDLALEHWKYVPHPYLVYCLNPAYRSLDGLNRHNALGFRGDDFPLGKPPGVYRIVCLGGSTVYDTEIEDHHLSFPARLEAQLREQGHPEVQVVNGGVGGYTSWETLVDYALRIRELEPDLVVLYHNSNDVHARLIDPAAFRWDNTGYRKVWCDRTPWWESSMLLRYLGVKLGLAAGNKLGEHVQARPAAPDPLATLAANGPGYFQRNTEEIVALARQGGARVMLATFAYCAEHGSYSSEAYYQQGFAQHDGVLRDVATRLEVPLYDFHAEMPTDLEYWADGVHNTAAGAQLKAQRFAAFILREFLP